jgi:hypothetical protein
MALALTGTLAATSTPASAQTECELVRVWLTINGVLAPTQLICL